MFFCPRINAVRFETAQGSRSSNSDVSCYYKEASVDEVTHVIASRHVAGETRGALMSGGLYGWIGRTWVVAALVMGLGLTGCGESDGESGIGDVLESPADSGGDGGDC